MVMFQYTLSKLIPVRIRGKLTGFRNFVSGVIAAGVAMIGGTYFIDNNILGNGYSTTFLLAFILTVTGLLMLLGIREPEPPRMRAQSSLLKHAKEIPSMLRTYASFTRFVLVRSVAALGMAAVPFYILYAGEMRILTGTDLSVLTVCFLLAQTGSNFLWGAIADKQGNRLVFMASIGVWVTSAILLLNTPNEMLWLSIAFGGLGIGLGGYMIGAMNLILEMGDRENLPMLLGISTAVNSLFFAMGPILGGLTAQYLGYQELIIGSTVLLAIALTLTAFLVQEPRRAN
jgi:MFS family permease